MRSVGKQTRDESGKYPVNEDDEENSCAYARRSPHIATGSLRVPMHSIVLKRSIVIASPSEAIHLTA
jgi:hypothetical protein